VKAGESFWTIAAAIAEQRLGHPPTVAEIDGVWRVLIDANRAQLPNPADPDLLYVGIVLTIPP
jgi:nucleoid-associated protein YgaU